ncbi:MAG: hypothetical protein QNJ12_01980 [Ilumatobacter sp.]|uniref:hypothetical protein n=1 Tax=Ilumatobacter sp. TaxID=1967498 RepID=UPI00260520AC|nr:hypothetical protein [Ilumatobacter sp.]MDJ0767524.1 hypothetical protein [Ilumatobacter sp.]
MHIRPELALFALLVASSCGGNGAGDAADLTAEETDCPALVTWFDAQQQFLDDVGDRSVAELGAGSDAVRNAGVRLGALLLEASREAAAFDCEEALSVGAEPRCRQIAQLRAGGDGGQRLLAELTAECA